MMEFHLDPHCDAILQEFRNKRDLYVLLERKATDMLMQALNKQGLYITAMEHRIKTEHSLAGKLELKGAKYKSLADITDILGMRVITFYTDDVDKVAAIVAHTFDIDWNNSVDKRKLHQLDSFGYNSLHYICRLPQTVIDETGQPELAMMRFEIQMRTALQHVWSTLGHDTQYKGSINVPQEYLRQYNRLAGMLELIDDEFSRLRTTLIDYLRNMQTLVNTGKLDEVPLTLDAFHRFLKLSPFDRLNQRIAAVNQAEIIPAPIVRFLPVFQSFGFKTLGDIQQFINENSEDAYNLALAQLAVTDFDIISENVGPQNLCVVHVLKNGQGVSEIKAVFDIINGEQDTNIMFAEAIIDEAKSLSFMQKNT
ncbi:MAG: hypothetical protein IJ546_07435 [Prevotella sp.]|nr:hypothetical protein [Prevotella sp.]